MIAALFRRRDGGESLAESFAGGIGLVLLGALLYVLAIEVGFTP